MTNVGHHMWVAKTEELPVFRDSENWSLGAIQGGPCSRERSELVDAVVMRTITRILVSIPIIALPFSALLGMSDTLVLEE